MQSFEINLKGISIEALRGNIAKISGASVSAKPNGASVQVSSEADVETLLTISKTLGGKLVSVQPLKQSLEELFVEKSE